jgi:membrane dipeptidase
MSRITVDGLVVSRWGADVFHAMHAGRLTAANCTVAVWEGFSEGMRNIARFKHWFLEYGRIIRPILSVQDIRAAHREGRVGVILGWQNTSPLEDDLSRLRLFHELGLRVAQLTYNTQNHVGSGCYESKDSGLSGFGHDVVAEMNALGIVIDLSHVGPKTSEDALRASAQPVAYTHVCPAALKPHRRNKADGQLRAVAERGGVVGVTPFAAFLPAATLGAYLDALEHVIDVSGEEHVAVGTDFTEGHDASFLEWIMRDKGHGRIVTDTALEELSLEMPAGLERLCEWQNVVAAMEARGWTERRIARVCGENWMRYFGDVWSRTPALLDEASALSSQGGAESRPVTRLRRRDHASSTGEAGA